MDTLNYNVSGEGAQMDAYLQTVELGRVVLATVGVITLVMINFACYAIPLRIVLSKAGLPPLPVKYYVQAFLATVLAGVIAAILLNLLLQAITG